MTASAAGTVEEPGHNVEKKIGLKLSDIGSSMGEIFPTIGVEV